MKDAAYYPSWKRASKYATYLRYLSEYIKYADWHSLFASLKFVVVNKPRNHSWISHSAMGKFRIRKGTTDFQFINYTYERRIRDYLKSIVSEMRYFIDIGACIGEYDVWLAKMGVNCIAFEPVNYEALEENVRLNGVEDKVCIFRCGLGLVREKVFFNIKSVVTGSSHIDRSVEGETEGNISIEVLDDVMRDFPIPEDALVVMKIDAEGMEMEILEGARDFITHTNHLQLLYEHTVSGNDQIQEILDRYGTFEYQNMDEFNMLARKMKTGIEGV